jgi:MFS family permease
MASHVDPRERRIPPLVWRFGWVSLFTDTATEMLYPIIPLFFTITLGAPVAALGLTEGIAEGIATGFKGFAGYITDRVQEHRRMVQLGYGISALSKPFMGLAPNWPVAGALRATDRVGKAVRGVPRDVMLAQSVPPEDRGRAFGFHRAMDTSGAVLGPLIALVAIIILGQNHLRPVFVIAFVPGLLSLWLLRKLPRTTGSTNKPWEKGQLQLMSAYGGMLAVTVLFSLGNSSDAFLLLRAHDVGLSTEAVVLTYVVYNLVYAALSLPAGIASDRHGRFIVFGAGLAVFAAVYLAFALTSSGAMIWPLMAVYGAYIALTDGVLKALIVDLVPDDVRGKALGVQQMVTGASVLFAGVTAGLLWDHVSHRAPFFMGAGGAVLALVALPFAARGRRDTVTA